MKENVLFAKERANCTSFNYKIQHYHKTRRRLLLATANEQCKKSNKFILNLDLSPREESHLIFF